jgi:predicted nuclease of predicted toxin-antitoxin system
MRLIADEGLDKPIVHVLRNADFDVLYILETNQGADDDLILATANSQQRILLTQDKDFGELVFRLQRAHYGVILIRLEGFAPALKAQIVLDAMKTHKEELINSFTVIQPNAIRIRKK